jgi:hypothetical protein
MKVRHEEMLNVSETDRLNQLALSALTAIKQQLIAPTPQKQ